jgi:predicted lipoprotein with Yx(FWY)xxD motif
MKPMTEYKKLIVALLIVIFVFAIGLTYVNQGISQPARDTATNKDSLATTTKLMTLVVYRQNKDEAVLRDCGITYPEKIQVLKTTAVADASLAYLFNNELARYGEYQSVKIEDGVAKVTINNPADPTGLFTSSLSSCESGHLFSVLEDTLTQYDSVTSVELYSPTGKIEF